MSAVPLYAVQRACPFCGGKGLLFQDKAVEPPAALRFFVACEDQACCEGPVRSIKLDAIKAWTTRHDGATLPYA